MKMMKNYIKTFAFCVCTLSAMNSYAISTDHSASTFFEEYQKLQASYDLKIKDLFLDQAKVSTTSYGDETETIYKISGKKLKTRLEDTMKYAQAMSSYDRYSNIQIKQLSNTDYKITADRYSLDTCYTDTSFNMTIQKQADQQFKILELHDSTIEIPKCTQPLKQDMPAKLQIMATAANKELPRQLDRITTLERVSTAKNTLIYHYILDDIAVENIDDKIIMMFEDYLNLSNCTTPSIKHEIDLGAELQHLFSDSTGRLLVNHVVNASVCKTFKPSE